jgi:hypothetical protein
MAEAYTGTVSINPIASHAITNTQAENTYMSRPQIRGRTQEMGSNYTTLTTHALRVTDKSCRTNLIFTASEYYLHIYFLNVGINLDYGRFNHVYKQSHLNATKTIIYLEKRDPSDRKMSNTSEFHNA